MATKTGELVARKHPAEVVHPKTWKGGKLTAAALAVVERKWQAAELYPDAGRLVVRDTHAIGLHLRLSRSGARAWAFSRRFEDRQRRWVFPNSSTMTLAEARAVAVQHKADTERGIDPLKVKRAKRDAARAKVKAVAEDDQRPTLAAVLDKFGRIAAKDKYGQPQRSWPQRRETIEAEYRRHLDRPLVDLTETHVRAVLENASKRGARVQGWHGYRYLRQVLAWAVRRKLIASDPTAGIDKDEVKETVSAPGERKRVLDYPELRRVWLALESTPGPYSAIYRLLLLTGARLSEVSTMKWCDVDMNAGIWTQQTNKSDRLHTVPLSDAAMAILRACRPGQGTVAPLFPPTRVFNSSAGNELGLKAGNWNRFSKRIMAASGTTGWTRHDLRRTAATLLAKAKMAPVVVEQLLNHSAGAGKGGMVARIYNQHTYGPEKRAAVKLLAELIEDIVAGTVTNDDDLDAMMMLAKAG